MRIETPSDRRLSMSAHSSCRTCGSSPTVGSSSRTRRGRWTSARAIRSRRRMPPESSSTRVSRRPVEVRDLERPLDRRRALVPAEPVEPREHAQVLLDRERGVEVVELGDDPALRPGLLRLAGQPVAQHLELALVGDRLGRQHLHGRRLAGAVRSQEPDAGARRHVQLEAVDRGDRAEALRHAPQSDRNVGVACHDPHGIAGELSPRRRGSTRRVRRRPTRPRPGPTSSIRAARTGPG